MKKALLTLFTFHLILVSVPAAAETFSVTGWDMGSFVKCKQPVLRPTPDSRFHCPIRGKEIRWEQQNVYNPAVVVRNGENDAFEIVLDIESDRHSGCHRFCRYSG